MLRNLAQGQAFFRQQRMVGGADIHTLSKQMGNSAAMIERHYSKLTATTPADRFA
jgi:hypothetical protein